MSDNAGQFRIVALNLIHTWRRSMRLSLMSKLKFVPENIFIVKLYNFHAGKVNDSTRLKFVSKTMDLIFLNKRHIDLSIMMEIKNLSFLINF